MMLRPDQRKLMLVAIAVGGMLALSAVADTINWKAGVPYDSPWHDPNNWVEGKVPADGDDVIIANAGRPLLTNATARLKSLVLRNRAIYVTNNWQATIFAENLILTNSLAQIAAVGSFVSGAPSNRIHIVCSNLIVHSGHSATVAAFLADHAGYRHGSPQNTHGHGPGFGVASYFSSGASHGGAGGASSTRYGTINTGRGNLITYGSADVPTAPGSGGGSGSAYPVYKGGDGGGAICIEASGDVVLHGLACSANGQAAAGYGGGGSGGSITISCRTISGNATIRANGGNRSTPDRAASGGGGRIAVHYNPALQTSIPNIRFEANPGRSGGFAMGEAEPGTVWFPNALFVTETIDKLSGQLMIPGFASWSPNTLLITNCWVRFPADGFKLKVTGDMTVGTGGRYDVGGDTYTVAGARVHRPLSTTTPVLDVGGDLTLVDGGILGVYSAAVGAFSGASGAGTGAWVKVSGDMLVSTNSWVYPYSHSTDGGSPYFTIRNLTVTASAGFNADYKGAAVRHTGYGYGYGYGSFTNGASYGGKGGPTNSSAVRPVYGSEQEPNHPGSSGSTTGWHMCMGGSGGGLIRILAEGTVQLDGTLTANGFHGKSYETLDTNHGYATGGSGGGIRVRCKRFKGGGWLTADGADSWLDGGCGGGGRIAVWRMFDAFNGTTSVAGGDMTTVIGKYDVTIPATLPGASGTVFWGDIPKDGTFFILR